MMSVHAGRPFKAELLVWVQATRAFSLTASLIPVAVGAALAADYAGEVAWGLFPLVIVCALLAQAATNLISDYFDFVNGVDQTDTFGSSRVLVDGLLRPRQMLVAGWVLFAVGLMLALVLIVTRGVPMLILALIALVGGYGYTGKPIGYKYFALGDVLVFTLMGPLMVIGSYLALTGSYDNMALVASLPIGFLVAAILHANNLRDIRHDAAAKVKTLANVLGHRAAKGEYIGLLIAAYVSVALTGVAGLLSPWSLLVFLSLPLAARNIRAASRCQEDKPEEIALLDVQTAQLHLLFGLLLVIGIAVGHFLQ